MPTITDYSIIETEWLEELKSMYLKHNKECEQDSPNEFHSNCGKIFLIEMLQSKIKPLIPIVEDTFNKTYMFCCEDKDFRNSKVSHNAKEDYINNTIIE